MKKFFTFLSLGLFVLSSVALLDMLYGISTFTGDGAGLMGPSLAIFLGILPIHTISIILILVTSWFKYEKFSHHQRIGFGALMILPFLFYFLSIYIPNAGIFYFVLVYIYIMTFSLANIFVVGERVNTINKVFKIITTLALFLLVIFYALYYFSIGLSNYI